MAKYKDLGEGLYGLETPLGRAVLRTDESTLMQAGHEPEADEQPVAMQDPGALSEAFGGAEAKAPKETWSKNPDGTFTRTGPDGSKWVTDLPPPEAPAPIRQQGVANVEAKEAAERERVRQGMAQQPVRFTGGKPAPAQPAPGAPVAPGSASGDWTPASPAGGQGQAGGEAPPQWNADELAALNQVGKEAMRGGGYSPGGMRLSSRTIKGKVLPPGTAEALAQEAARPDPAQPAMEKLGYTQVLANEAQADALRDWGEEEQNMIEEERFKRAAIDREITRKENEAQRVWQEAGKVPAVDAQRLWSSKTTLGKILASVLLGVGYIIAAKTGVNPAQVAFNKANDDDIEEQKIAFERAQAAGKAADNAYARELDRWGKPEVAQQALRLRGEKVFDAMIKERALRTQNPEIMARVELWAAEREDARNRAWSATIAQMAPAVEETFKYQAPSGGGGGLAKAIKAQRNTAEDLRVLRGQAPIPGKGAGGVGEQRAAEHFQKIQIHNLPGGVTGYAPGEDAAKIRIMQAQKAALDDGVKRVAALREELKQGKLKPLDYYSRLQSLNAQMGVSFKDKTGLGAWDNGVVTLWSQITGLPAGKERSLTNAYGAVPTPAELVGILQSKGRLDEFKKQSDSLFQETLRYRVTRDPQGTVPFYTETPE